MFPQSMIELYVEGLIQVFTQPWEYHDCAIHKDLRVLKSALLYSDGSAFHKTDKRRKRDSKATKYKKKTTQSGSITFTFQVTGNPTRSLVANDIPIMKRVRHKLRCDFIARSTADYPHGHKHSEGADINLEKHGDKVVKITCKWKHEYPFATVAHVNMSRSSRRLRSALRIVVRPGVMYHVIDKARNEYLDTSKGNVSNRIT